jgi:hypothetical protein
MRLVALGTALSLAARACTHREPPAPEGSPSVALPDFVSPPAPSSASPAPAPKSALSPWPSAIRATPSAASPPSSSSPSSAAIRSSAAGLVPSAAGASESASTQPELSSADDSSRLPQTRDMPTLSGARFEARVKALWDAIVEGDSNRAMPFFFPLGAYEQVKDVGNPAADWKHRLVAAYSHDIHALHARLGADAPRARLVGIEVPQGRAGWVEPGEEYNKIGYYRVFGSRLRYEIDGTARTFDVKSLISWRGDWYVVHLSAIK